MLKFSEYLAVAFAATLKFVGGPLAGVAFKLSWWETALCSAFGMMVTVVSVIYGGHALMIVLNYLNRGKKRKVFSKTKRFAVKVKVKLGLWGVAILTPFLFTPILGSFIALHFKYKKRDIFWTMLACALFAGVVQTWLIILVKELILMF